MYTGRTVTRLIQPVAICVVLVLGALPGVTLACQWACSGVGKSAHHHATHHDDSTAAPDTIASEATSVVGTVRLCAHSMPSVVAVMAASLKVLAPLATDVSGREFVAPSQVIVVAADRGTSSPPGARSAPLPLRI